MAAQAVKLSLEFHKKEMKSSELSLSRRCSKLREAMDLFIYCLLSNIKGKEVRTGHASDP